MGALTNFLQESGMLSCSIPNQSTIVAGEPVMSENNNAFRIQRSEVKGHGGDITSSGELH